MLPGVVNKVLDVLRAVTYAASSTGSAGSVGSAGSAGGGGGGGGGAEDLPGDLRRLAEEMMWRQQQLARRHSTAAATAATESSQSKQSYCALLLELAETALEAAAEGSRVVRGAPPAAAAYGTGTARDQSSACWLGTVHRAKGLEWRHVFVVCIVCICTEHTV